MWATGTRGCSMHSTQQCVWGVWKPAKISGTQPGWKREKQRDVGQEQCQASSYLSMPTCSKVCTLEELLSKAEMFRANSTSVCFNCILRHYRWTCEIYYGLLNALAHSTSTFHLENSSSRPLLLCRTLGKFVHSTLLQFTHLQISSYRRWWIFVYKYLLSIKCSVAKCFFEKSICARLNRSARE